MKQGFPHYFMGMALATTALGAFAQTAAPQPTAAAAVAPADERFDIKRFDVQGNTLLSAQQVEQAVAPYSGPGRVYGDVQRALEALENSYRSAGFTAVQVFVPEQELTSGIVRIQVTETVIGKVTVTDNKYFNEANIRASVPSLKEGVSPNLRRVSESVQLANDNPAKQVNVVLSADEEEGKVDANIAVTDNNPIRVMLTADNTGSADTGKWRTGVALQHSNLFNRDHVATVAYTTSPDTPSGSKVDLYSLGYRVPLYAYGDSLDFIYGKSSVTSGTTPTLGSTLAITGKGDIYAMRWNHFFARQGESTSKLVTGIDYKRIDSSCDLNGVSVGGTLIETCQGYSTMPVSLTYSAQRQSVGEVLDYNLGVARNIAMGKPHSSSALGVSDRYSAVASGRSAADHFVILRGGVSYLKAYASDWQMRLAATGQATGNALPPAEQFGLVGATTVRGFSERAAAADSGVVANAEVYTPELLGKTEIKGNLRLLGFFDAGRGFNNNAGGASLIPSTLTVASMGVGARYNLGRDFVLRLDVARVFTASTSGISGASATEKRGDLNAHLSAVLGF